MTPTKADEQRAPADAPHSRGNATSAPETGSPATGAAGEGEQAPMTMRERLARVLCQRQRTNAGTPVNPDWRCAMTGKTNWEENLPDIDAILAALAEPTDAMVNAGIDAWSKSPLAVVTQFRAMLKAAGE